MGLISWIILGLIAGALAKFLTPGPDPGGCLVTTLIGIVGASIGGFIGTQLGWGSVDAFDLRGLGLATLGGVLVLVVYRNLTRH